MNDDSGAGGKPAQDHEEQHEITRRSPAARMDDPWGQLHDDDMRQFLFRDQTGALDGCYTFSGAEAIARALKYGLTVVERRWSFVGERVYWAPQDETPFARNHEGRGRGA